MAISSVLLFIGGLAVLIIGADVLVRGSSRLALSFGLSPLVMGLTVVAFGSSAPEVAASTTAVLSGEGELAFGNVIGSNIFNVLFALGVAAMLTPLVVARKLVRQDVPIMIGASIVVALMALDGAISRVEGILLLMALSVWIAGLIRAARRGGEEDAPPEMNIDSLKTGKSRGLAIALILAGLAMLSGGAHLMVTGAVEIARALGLSELIIGLTVVSAGTGMPETVTSAVAALKGERDIAVGNVVGSNIFNLLCVLGVASVAGPEGVPVPIEAMRFDVPVMIATCVACLPIFFSGYKIARWEGAVLVGYYAAYLAFLVLSATDHDSLGDFSWVMLAFVVPLTVLTFAVVGVRQLRREPRD